jgi:glutamate-1-semialdehyde 2,1-aminomutase
LEKFSAFYNGMRREGIYIAPSQFEALFISAAHETEHIEATLDAAERVLAELSR